MTHSILSLLGNGMCLATKAVQIALHVISTICETVLFPIRNDFERLRNDAPVARNLKEKIDTFSTQYMKYVLCTLFHIMQPLSESKLILSHVHLIML